MSRTILGVLGLGLVLTIPMIDFTQAQAEEAEVPPWSETTQALGAAGPMPSGVLSAEELARLTALGETLFVAKFTREDGAGRPGATQAILPTKARSKAVNNFARTSGPDSNACASCHNDPVVGGAGDFITTTFLSEGFSSADFDSTDPQFSNERGTTHLFGAGLIELLAREMSADLAAIRRQALAKARRENRKIKAALKTKGVSFGFLSVMPDGLADLSAIEGIDSDLVVRPFSQKGVMTSLRQFTVNAMNHHHGMQAGERFGARWTGSDDFDEDGHARELGESDISALVAWQASLPPPQQKVPDHAGWRSAAAKGETLMEDFGCTECHQAALPLRSLSFQDPGPFDAAGTLNARQVEAPATYDLALRDWAAGLPRNAQGEIMVPLFGDLKRHQMTDRSIESLGNELLSQRFVDRNIFMTAELWGLGSTAPYGHRNDFTTINEIILAHAGEGRAARDAYAKALADDRSNLIAYLKTLVIEP